MSESETMRPSSSAHTASPVAWLPERITARGAGAHSSVRASAADNSSRAEAPRPADGSGAGSAGRTTGSTRRWTHYSELLVIDAWILVLYSLLYGSRLVPRALAAFGLITVMLHFAGITLPLFLGYSSVTLLGMTMGFSHIALAIWLLVKGFEERNRPLRAEGHGVEVAGAGCE